MNYAFSQKNHWRNRVWNQIFDRVKCHPRDAVVLYLAAEQDLDRATALRKGFRNENLIAIDRDRAAVEKIRASGNLAIHGSFDEVCVAWPNHTPVAALIADFTCGLEPSVGAAFSIILLQKAFSTSTFVVNMLRGRDPKSNGVRGYYSPLLNDLKRRQCFPFLNDISDKHRAAQLFLAVPDVLCRMFNKPDWYPHLIAQIAKEGSPLFGSYSSGPQIFDWGVWGIEMPDTGGQPHVSNSVSGQISAVLAHRTRRLAA